MHVFAPMVMFDTTERVQLRQECYRASLIMAMFDATEQASLTMIRMLQSKFNYRLCLMLQSKQV